MKDCIICGATIYRVGGESICEECRLASGRICICCNLEFIEKGVLRKNLIQISAKTVQKLFGIMNVGVEYTCPACDKEIHLKEY